MKLYAFDFEVFAYDWLVVFKDIADNEFIVFHNDNYGVKQFVTEDKLFIGFNSKSYDRFILQAVLCGADNRMVKEINDFIIDGVWVGNIGFCRRTRYGSMWLILATICK